MTYSEAIAHAADMWAYVMCPIAVAAGNVLTAVGVATVAYLGVMTIVVPMAASRFPVGSR